MRLRLQITVLGVAALMVAGIGISYAAATAAAAPSPVIHACKANRDGGVRIVGRTVRCRAGETRVTWNQRGVPGPRGPSNAYLSQGAGISLPAGQETPVRALFLPAGSYVLNFSMIVSLHPTAVVRCSWDPGLEAAWSGNPYSQNTWYDTLAATHAVRLNKPTTVWVYCKNDSTSRPPDVRTVTLTAVRVGTLTIAP